MTAMNVPSSAPPSNHDFSAESHQRLLARYDRLLEVSRQLNSTLDLGELLTRIVIACTELIDTEEASILLVDPATGELRFEAASNMTAGAMAAIPVPLEGSLGGWVVTHGEPVLVENARSDARWFSNVDKTLQFETRNLLAVPMKAHNEVIGVVEGVNKRNDQPWTQDDVSTLSALASQAAIAIQNARLFQQSDFIAEMVHELRTPLAAIKASTALLLRPTLPIAQREEIVRTMQQETDRLTAMTTDFLDLARLESGRVRLEKNPFGLLQLFAECIEIVRPQAAERDIRIDLRGPEFMVNADRGKIKQVMLNLLTNAIKYNRDQGVITCNAALHQEASRSDPALIAVSVSDTGQGIKPEDQRHVFDKFYRIPDTAGYTVGTGLGLAIAQRIVQAHGCEMWLESEVGVGTTFYFTLPLVQHTIGSESLFHDTGRLPPLPHLDV